MKTSFWLFGQFETPLIDAGQVAGIFRLRPKTIRNRAAAGSFPAPRTDGLWHIDDVADYIDRTGSVPGLEKAA